MSRCKHCGHSPDAHAQSDCVVCGCVKLETRDPKAREERCSTTEQHVCFYGHPVDPCFGLRLFVR
jgi:hypothetical protein